MHVMFVQNILGILIIGKIVPTVSSIQTEKKVGILIDYLYFNNMETNFLSKHFIYNLDY